MGTRVIGDDMKRIRHQLGLSTLELGRVMGYDGADNTVSVTIRRYESGQRPLPPWLGRLLLMLERYGVPDDFRQGRHCPCGPNDTETRWGV